MDDSHDRSVLSSHGQTVILCGGGGSRLWPLSRADRPKPFLPLFGEKCSFDLALEVARTIGENPPLILASCETKTLVQQRLTGQRQTADIILEAAACDTALAIAVAVEVTANQSPDIILTILPSDHWIGDVPSYGAALTRARGVAQRGRLVVLGVQPDNADERFGYVCKGPVLMDGTCSLLGFVEKPNAAKAQELVRDGWLWNAGSVVARADTLQREIIVHAPDVARVARDMVFNSSLRHTSSGTLRCLPVPETLASHIPRSFDMAVLEHTKLAAVVQMNSGWADIGTWKELWAMREPGGRNCRLSGPVQSLDCEASLVWADGTHVTAIGLQDMAVVATRDAVLVAAMADLPKLKLLVAALKADPATRCLTDTTFQAERGFESAPLLHTNGDVSVKLVQLQTGCGLGVEVSDRQRHLLVLTGCVTLSSHAADFTLKAGNRYILEAGCSARLQSTNETGAELLEVSYPLLVSDSVGPMASNHSTEVPQPLA